MINVFAMVLLSLIYVRHITFICVSLRPVAEFEEPQVKVFKNQYSTEVDFSGGSVIKNLCNAGDIRFDCWVRRFPGNLPRLPGKTSGKNLEEQM